MWSASSRPQLVARQHPPPVVDDSGDRAPVGVGVIRHHQIGPGSPGQRQGHVDRTRFLRVREGDSGEVRIRFGLFGNLVGGREPRRSGQFPEGAGPHTVHRGVHPGDLAGGPLRDETGAPGHVVAGDLVTHHLVRVAARKPGEGIDGVGGDAGGDLCVRRRDDLRPVTEIDLVAVVGGRVVGGRHDDPRDAAVSADTEGNQGGSGRVFP